MYALIHNSQLILGPIRFNYRLINSELEDLELTERIGPRAYEGVPYTINADTFLLPAQIVIDGEYDGRFQNLSNFEWTILTDEYGNPNKVQFTHTPIEKPLEQVKEEYKRQIPSLRWGMENKLLTLTINNTEVQVSTDREERAQFVTKLVSCSNLQNASHDYKFRNGAWVVIGCTEIQYILEQIDHEIQDAFDWEHAKLQEIDACTTAQEVYNVVL